MHCLVWPGSCQEGTAYTLNRGAGDPTQRLVLPPGLEGADLTGRNVPPADGAGASPTVQLPSHGAGQAGTSLADLDEDARGSGTLLPNGYTVVTRTAAVPTSARSRTWKEYFAPDGTRLQSRAAAWRHFVQAPTLPETYAIQSQGASNACSAAASAQASMGASPTGSEGSAVVSRAAGLVSFDACGRRSRVAGPSPVPGTAPDVAQRTRGLAVPPSDVAARLGEVARQGGAGSRIARELLD